MMAHRVLTIRLRDGEVHLGEGELVVIPSAIDATWSGLRCTLRKGQVTDV